MAQLRLGELYLAQRLRTELGTAFRAAAKAARGTVDGRIAEACALDASGQSDEALAVMQGVVKTYPDNGEAHGVVANFLARPAVRRRPRRIICE